MARGRTGRSFPPPTPWGWINSKETVRGIGFAYDRKDLDVSVRGRLGEGARNRLYFLYEASDDYWDFRRGDRHNDIFELVVDGDGRVGR
jgi:hypothetical protein